MKSSICSFIQSSVDNYNRLLLDDDLQNNIEIIVKKSIEAFQLDKKILLCGNGGSASDAQHIASELSGRFYSDRPPLYAEALHVNTSYITAVANDLSFSQVYARALQAKAKKGDVLIGLSTSGKSQNIIEAFKMAKEMDVITISLIGQNKSQLEPLSNYLISS